MFSGAEIKLMETKLMPEIVEACKLMEKARAWLAEDMSTNWGGLAPKLLGIMDSRLVMHIHGFEKKVTTRRPYPSLDAIAQEFVRNVQRAGGDLANSPWKLPPAAPAASAQTAPQNTIAEYPAGGSLDIGQVKSVVSFGLGATVELKNEAGSRTFFHIAKVEPHAVTLIAADSSTKILTPRELVDLYKAT